MSYQLETDEAVCEAIRRCAREQLDRAVGELSENLGEVPVEAVHRARKAVKKERSLLRLARGAMPVEQRRRENLALRDAARKLSAVRDADVLIETLNQLSEHFAGQLPHSTFEAIGQRLRQRGQMARSVLDSHAADELELVRLRVDGWELVHGGWAALEPGLVRSYRNGRKVFARTRRSPSMEDLHAWRKRTKDLCYQERLLAPSCGPAVRGHASDAHRLANLLGDAHDLDVLRETLTLGQIDVGVDLAAVVSLIDHRRLELQTEAIQLGKRVYAENPKAFRQRTRRCWKAGRATAHVPSGQKPAELARATRVPLD